MVGISGLDEFINGLNELTEKAEKLNNVTISIDPTDNVTSVQNKLREEIRRSGAMELPEPTLREIAEKKLNEARSQF